MTIVIADRRADETQCGAVTRRSALSWQLPSQSVSGPAGGRSLTTGSVAIQSSPVVIERKPITRRSISDPRVSRGKQRRTNARKTMNAAWVTRPTVYGSSSCEAVSDVTGYSSPTAIKSSPNRLPGLRHELYMPTATYERTTSPRTTDRVSGSSDGA